MDSETLTSSLTNQDVDGRSRLPPPLPTRPPPIDRMNQRLRPATQSVSEPPVSSLSATLPVRPKSLHQQQLDRQTEQSTLPTRPSILRTASDSSFEMNAILAPVVHAEMSWEDNWSDPGDEVEDLPFAVPVDQRVLINPIDMSVYENRLATFHNWPQNHPQQPKTFAKYGMFYTGNGDRTQCYSCGVVIWGWEPYQGDPKAPIRAHKKFHPVCKFLRDRAWSDTISTMHPTGLMLNWDKADAPHMIHEDARRDTYKILPMNNVSRSAELAEAGFYLLESTKIACFYCGTQTQLAGLQDPWLTHAQLSTGCTFLKRKRGPNFIRRANRKPSSDPDSNDGDSNSSATDLSANYTVVQSVLSKVHGIQGFVHRKNKSIGKVAKHLWNGKPQEQQTTFVVTTAPAGPPVHSARRVSAERASSSDWSVEWEEPTPTVATLNIDREPRRAAPPVPKKPAALSRDTVSAVVMGQQSALPVAVRRPSATIDLTSLDVVLLDEAPASSTETVDPGPTVAGMQDSPELDAMVTSAISMGFSKLQVEEAMAEHKRRGSSVHLTAESLVQIVLDLNSAAGDSRLSVEPEIVLVPTESLCVVCMDFPANHVFVPCGHLKTCGSCCALLTECPICRQVIQSKIRVYL